MCKLYQNGMISPFAYGLANHGGSISELTGDIQSVSNIEAENSWRLYEVWANVPIKTLNGSLLVGLYDLNSEFDVINTGGLFLNSSHGIGPDFSSSGVTGPSIFPYTSLAVRFKVNFMQGFTSKEPYLTPYLQIHLTRGVQKSIFVKMKVV